MRSNITKKAVVLFALTSLLIPFQNCSQQFKVADQLSQGQSSVLSAAPVVSLVSAPDMVNTAVVTISFDVSYGASTQKSLMCQLGNNAVQDCSAKSISFNNLIDGDYSLKIIAENAQGTKTEMVKMFRKDTTAPTVTVAAMPASVTNMQAANFSFTAADTLSGVLNTECSLDNAAFAVCASPVNLAALAAGSHNFRIRANDRAGNVSALYSYTWMVDLTAPTVNLGATPLAVTNQVNASFSFSGVGIVSYECQIDNGAYAACTSPQAYANLAATNHTFRVRGTNTAGSVSAASQFMWMIDNVAPNAPTLVSNVPASTALTAASFTFTSADSGSGLARFECSLDNVAFAVCTSPRALTNLAAGNHNFRVKAFDNAGNESAISQFSWMIQQAIPTWTVPTISFTVGSGATFDLKTTLPTGVVAGGVFTVDTTGAALPAGMSLAANGVLSVGTAVVGDTTGVIFAYMEP